MWKKYETRESAWESCWGRQIKKPKQNIQHTSEQERDDETSSIYSEKKNSSFLFPVCCFSKRIDLFILYVWSFTFQSFPISLSVYLVVCFSDSGASHWLPCDSALLFNSVSVYLCADDGQFIGPRRVSWCLSDALDSRGLCGRPPPRMMSHDFTFGFVSLFIQSTARFKTAARGQFVTRNWMDMFFHSGFYRFLLRLSVCFVWCAYSRIGSWLPVLCYDEDGENKVEMDIMLTRDQVGFRVVPAFPTPSRFSSAMGNWTKLAPKNSSDSNENFFPFFLQIKEWSEDEHLEIVNFCEVRTERRWREDWGHLFTFFPFLSFVFILTFSRVATQHSELLLLLACWWLKQIGQECFVHLLLSTTHLLCI